MASLLALAAAAALSLGPARPAGATGEQVRHDEARPLVLARASAALGGRPGAGGVDATLALRDLFLARPTLDEGAGGEADRLLARPTDGSADPYGDGYRTGSQKTCATHVCVHWVSSTEDAPPDRAWAMTTLRVMEQVWAHHVDELGYRAPATDGRRGGNARFDVYLKELGSKGLYGYCAPEHRVPGQRRQASGFCVLDNDFARSQFGRAPIDTLRVTAAHEFFHAIQFAYDFREDPWLMESTATWMEEQFADDVDDNRAYLPYGQVARPATSLDLFDPNGLAHYGNWAFWEYVSEHLGRRVVREVVERTGTGGGLPDEYSMQAVRRALQAHGGFARAFGRYAVANADPRRAYAEGRAFPVAPADVATRLRPTARATTYEARVNHLASKILKLKPARALRGRAWRLRVVVAGPRSSAAPWCGCS